MNPVTSIIIRREYMERVTKKSFIITTLLVPLLMLAVSAIPSLIMLFATGGQKTIAVVDDSGVIFPSLKSSDDVRYVSAWDTNEQMLAADSIFGVLVIDRNIVKRPSGLKLLTPSASSVTLEEDINRQVSKIIETERLKEYDIENLDEILAQVKTSVSVQTIRTDRQGEEEAGQSAALASGLGIALNFVLYMFLLLYGSLVMNSIIEEKNNRVLEIVVSSINPRSLLLGKIVGVGLVAVTQIVIWAVVLTLCVTFLLPAVLPADMMAEVAAARAGNIDLETATTNTDLLMAMEMFSRPGFLLGIGLLAVAFLVGGYLVYASIFAMIGAAVDNVQDASQLQMLGLAPIMIGLFASMAVVNDPNSTFAVIMSLFPLTSPMVMMARAPFGVAGWETGLSLALLFATIIFMVWLAAKIYRIGIFMYGKKPTVKSLWQWARYK